MEMMLSYIMKMRWIGLTVGVDWRGFRHGHENDKRLFPRKMASRQFLLLFDKKTQLFIFFFFRMFRVKVIFLELRGR